MGASECPFVWAVPQARLDLGCSTQQSSSVNPAVFIVCVPGVPGRYLTPWPCSVESSGPHGYCTSQSTVASPEPQVPTCISCAAGVGEAEEPVPCLCPWAETMPSRSLEFRRQQWYLEASQEKGALGLAHSRNLVDSGQLEDTEVGTG